MFAPPTRSFQGLLTISQEVKALATKAKKNALTTADVEVSCTTTLFICI